MAHIEQGNQRQYFSQAVEQTADYGDIGQNLIDGGMQIASITQMANESKMSNYQVDLSTKFLEKNNEINTKYQQDPTSPEREREIKEAFENLSGEYKINPLCQGQWRQIKNNVYNNYKQYNTQWKLQQQQTNATNDLKNGYEALINQVSMMGINGASVDEIRLIYQNGIDGLSKGATAVLGSEVSGQFLKDSNHDIMTSYVSALASKNPLQAQALMKDSGVINDIGRAETIDKLNSYINNSIINQNKQVAFEELGNSLRAMNSDEAKTILEGRADLNQVSKFIQNNKKIPEASKDLILGIYGIGSRSEYYYDRDKGKITKNVESIGRGKSSVIPTSKMSAPEKQFCAEILENDLHNLISFSMDNAGKTDVKQIVKSKGQKEASQGIMQYMNKVASVQGRIDSAYNAGVIDKKTRDRYIDSYITPVTEYLGSNLSQLDEATWFNRGEKLGYDRISKQFNTKGLKGEQLRTTQKQKLFAQNYYLDELNKVVNKIPNLRNIYDIESLPSRQQQEIYKTASDNALKRAKRWTDKPEYFFAKEYPTVYSQPYVFFNKQDALAVTRVVAEATYKRAFEDINGKSTIELQDFAKNKMITEINNQTLKNRIKAGDTLALRPSEPTISRPAPKNINEFYQRVKALGVTPDEFIKSAEKRGFLELQKPRTIKQGIIKAYNEEIGNGKPMAGYYEALREAERIKALEDAKKKRN